MSDGTPVCGGRAHESACVLEWPTDLPFALASRHGCRPNTSLWQGLLTLRVLCRLSLAVAALLLCVVVGAEEEEASPAAAPTDTSDEPQQHIHEVGSQGM